MHDNLPKIDVTPILDLRQLRSIEIVGFTIDLAVVPLWRMFLAWPNLESLNMDCPDVSSAISLSDFSKALHYASPRLKVLRGLWVECNPECVPSHQRTSYPNLEHLYFLIYCHPNGQLSRGPLIHYLTFTFPGVDLMQFGARLWDDPRSIMLAFGAHKARKAGHIWTLDEFNESDYKAFLWTNSPRRCIQTKGYNALYFLSHASQDSASLEPKLQSKQNATNQRMVALMPRRCGIRPHYHVLGDNLPWSMRNVGHVRTGHDKRRVQDW
jgi:hypothetical protein